MTVHRFSLLAVVCGVLNACNDGAPRGPNPTGYAWPDSFSYLMEFVSESRAETVVVARYEERKALRFAVRDDRYLVWHDSVIKESLAPGRAPVLEPFEPEDTLHYYVELSRRGEAEHAEPGCDPALPACREALPSSLPLELRRLIPRLPVWAPPPGSIWEDTLTFDDTPRPRGVRGLVVTTYRVAGDTVIAGGSFWMVTWRAIRRTFTGTGGLGAPVANPPIEERGMVFIDKDRQLPIFATWAGGAVAPAGLRAAGVTSTGFRGRAYLAGSLVEQLLSPE